MKKLVLTVSIGYRPWFKITRTYMEKYSRKVGAEFKVIKKIHNLSDQSWWTSLQMSEKARLQKLLINKYLSKYDRILYLDDTCIICPDCPDLFSIVSYYNLGAVVEPLNIYPGKIHTWKKCYLRYNIPFRGQKYDFFNSGMLVVSKAHHKMFSIEYNIKRFGGLIDQPYLNAMKNKYKIKLHDLGIAFNYLGSLIKKKKHVQKIFIYHLTRRISDRENCVKYIDYYLANNKAPPLPWNREKLKKYREISLNTRTTEEDTFTAKNMQVLAKLTNIDELSIASYEKIIHQIWIGENPLPISWINTWRDWTAKHSDWTHILWTEDLINSLHLINKKAYLEEKSLAGKANIVRYEVLYNFGGVYIDADCVWSGKDCIEIFFSQKDTKEIWTVKEPNKKIFANSVIGCKRHSEIMKDAINRVKDNYEKDPETSSLDRKRVFKNSGPILWTNTVKDYLSKVTVFESHMFYPFPWWSERHAKRAHDEFLEKKYSWSFSKTCYMVQFGYTSNISLWTAGNELETKQKIKPESESIIKPNMDTGANMETGAKTMDIGAKTADTGAKTADIGAKTMDTGAKTVDTGAKTVDIGAKTVDIGANMDTGAKTVDTGAKTMDTGAKTVDIVANTENQNNSKKILSKNKVVVFYDYASKNGSNRIIGINKLMEDTLKTHKIKMLPNVTLLVSTKDHPIFNKDHRYSGSFCFDLSNINDYCDPRCMGLSCDSNPRDYPPLIIPDFAFGAPFIHKNIGYSYDKVADLIKHNGEKITTSLKAGFIGRPTGSLRQKLKAMENKDLEVILLKEASDFIPMWRYPVRWKYLIDIEGSTYSTRVKFLLFSRRVILRVDRKHTEYYETGLKPWVHYVPVKNCLSDLYEKIAWCKKNPNECKKIVRNALNYGETKLRYKDVLGHMSMILRQMNLGTDSRKINSMLFAHMCGNEYPNL